MGAVFFSLLLVTSSVIVHSVRERQGEFALLHALGFPRGRIRALVVAEAALLLLAGGLMGLALSAAGVLVAEHLSGGMLVLSAFSLMSWGTGLMLMLGLGLVIGFVPVVRYSRSDLTHVLSARL